MSNAKQVSSVLMDIEMELRQLNVWQQQPPPLEALASTQPFCIDTLNFTQWLQFILLKRMGDMIEQQLPLPGNCLVAPMAEEYFNGMSLDTRRLISHLAALDQLLSA